MEDWALALGDWLQTAGYVGAAALDFVEYRDPGTGRPRAVFGGAPAQAREAGYLLALGRGLGAAAFVSGTVATRFRGFERLREILGRLLYDPDRGEGVIPYAGGCPEQGGCPIVVVGCGRQRASELLGKAQAALAARLTVAAGGR
jgi:hypothetical protein